MGHFSQTCLLSHLPITGGTPIRVCLLVGSPYKTPDRHGDGWSFRSIPFRAEYNDYGGIENVHPEDQILVDLALAQFNRDAVEIPQGDNPYHDPPVTRGMPQEAWWDALWEGRLTVSEGYGEVLKVKVPKGVPTWRRVSKYLDRAVTKGELINGFTVNRIAYGLVRVTYHGDYTKRYEWYKAIQPILARRYKVTERYEHGLKYHAEMVAAADKLGEDPKVRASLDVWFEVAPKDGEYPPVSPAVSLREKRLMDRLVNSMGNSVSGARKKLPIAWAFIREDAWQAALPLGGPNYTGWGNSPTVEGEKAKILEVFESSLKGARMWKEILSKKTTIAALEAEGMSPRDLAGLLVNLEHKCPLLKSTPPFVQGMAQEVEDLLNREAEGTITQEQKDRVVQALAEYAVVRTIMSTVCIDARPTHGGPQDGAWEAHVAFHNAMTPVVLKADPYPPEEDEDGPGDDPREEVTDEETTYGDYSDVDIEHD